MNRAVRTIFDITITFGVVCAAISFFLMSRQDRPAWWLLVFLIVAGGIGEYATIVGDEEEGEHGFSFATTAHLTAAMLLMPGWAAPVAALGSMAGECSRRARPLVIALNGALATIATLAASAVFHGVQGSGTFGLQSYLAVGAMLLVFIPLNLFPPGLAATIVSQKAVRPLAWLPPADLLTYVTEACLAASITLVVKTAPAFLFFLIPLLIAMFLSLKRARLLSRETRYTLRALVSVIDAKDPSTAAHSERVGDLSARLAEALGLGGRDVRNIRWAGRLHDIGKVAVDDAILQKGSQLDALEWEAMRRHPAVGAELLEPLGLTRVLTPDRKSTRLNSSHGGISRMPSSA